MKKQIGIAVAASLLVLVSGCKNEESTKAAPEELVLDTMEKKVSYIFGYNVARQTMQTDFMLDADVLAAAIKEVHAGAEPRFTDEEIQATITAWRAAEREKAQAKHQEEQQANLEKAEAFLAENAQKEGVIVTESGLQYKVLQEGDGASPTDKDTVKVHYRGRLVDGTEFDSSYERGEPAEFVVGSLIPGWIEALQLMQVGDKFEIYVPSKLGYGAGGTNKIPPNSAIIFEMELLGIVPKEDEAAASEE